MSEFGGGYPERHHNSGITRRKLLTIALAGAGGAVVASHREKLPLINQLGKINQQSLTGGENPTGPDQQEVRLQEAIQKINTFRDLPLNGSDARVQAEKDYVAWANSAEETRFGFMGMGKRAVRAELEKKEFQIRQSGKSELTPLPKEYIEWANKQEIHPEVLGICLDAYPIAYSLIDFLKPKLREEAKEDASRLAELSVEDIMPSIGAMAGLITYETGRAVTDEYNRKMGFTFIGADYAIQNYGGKDYKINGPKDLALVCKKLSQDTGINYTVSNMQGSENPYPNNPDSSGGALGVTQMMPDRVLEIYDLMDGLTVEGKPFPFNPFDPKSAVVGTWLFLAQNKWIPSVKDWRVGWNYKDPSSLRKTTKKWNGLPAEMDFILDHDNSYLKSFAKAP